MIEYQYSRIVFVNTLFPSTFYKKTTLFLGTIMDPSRYYTLTLNIHLMGTNISKDEVEEFAGRFSDVISVKMGYNKAKGTPADFIILKLIGRLTGLKTVVDNYTFRGKPIKLTITKIEPLSKELDKKYNSQ